MIDTVDHDAPLRDVEPGHYVKLWRTCGTAVLGMVDRVDRSRRVVVFEYPYPLPAHGMNDGAGTLVSFDSILAIRHFASASVATIELSLSQLRIGHQLVIAFPYGGGTVPRKRRGVLRHVDWQRRELMLDETGEHEVIAFERVASIVRRPAYLAERGCETVVRQVPDWIRRYGGGWMGADECLYAQMLSVMQLPAK